ncbi:hypothetical protein LEN26_018075 [Aphanomyces euteiches]|nr:hypothetical protein LEN26_018075 [Aphanomyces euteiches]KAH9127692.1 hypothetical protein AeMF1_002053 [Aphanomyces euteiches]KAH9194567.1 hypothetical protein AeNC1_003447 [Aphanomyces euteiches]
MLRRKSYENPLIGNEMGPTDAHASSMKDLRVTFEGGLATPESDDMTQPTAVYRSMFAQRSQSFGTPRGSFGGTYLEQDTLGTPQSTPRSVRDSSRVSVQDIAKDMVANRKMVDEGVNLAHPEEVRDSIRMIHAYSRRELPLECDLRNDVRIKNKPYTLHMSRDSFVWFKDARRVGFVETDDIVGAETIAGKRGSFRLHYFRKGCGKGQKALLRKHETLDIDMTGDTVAAKWIQVIQELVRWQARAPPTSQKRRIRVVVNPHSGKRRAPLIWENEVKPFFDLAGFDYHVDHTTYGGHAVDMGREYSTEEGYEAIVFVSGDGTICEYMNGLLTRPEEEWKEVVATTPISLISAGTQNAFGTGVGIPTTAAAVYCIIKRKLRPLDVCTTVAEQDRQTVHYSCCGLGWGLPGDIAEESEKYRWMGTKRYAFMKVKRALFPKKHSGRINYVPLKPQPPLRRYDDIKNIGADDQYEAEEGNIYDGLPSVRNAKLRAASKLAGAVRSPASPSRYREEWWTSETGQYVGVGVLNSAPDGAYCHPSDGCLDLMVARKGNIFQMIHLAVLYLLGKELESKLMSYVKVKAVVIEQDQPGNVMNMDGEVLSGPGPWRMEVVPSLFKVLSEK